MLEAYIIIVLLGVALFVLLRIDMKKRWEKQIIARQTSLWEGKKDHLKTPAEVITEEEPPLQIPQWIDDLLNKIADLGIEQRTAYDKSMYDVRVEGDEPRIWMALYYRASYVHLFVGNQSVNDLIEDARVQKYLNDKLIDIVKAHESAVAAKAHAESVRIVRSSLAMIGITNVDIK